MTMMRARIKIGSGTKIAMRIARAMQRMFSIMGIEYHGVGFMSTAIQERFM